MDFDSPRLQGNSNPPDFVQFNQISPVIDRFLFSHGSVLSARLGRLGIAWAPFGHMGLCDLNRSGRLRMFAYPMIH